MGRPAISRIIRQSGSADLVEILSERLSRTDLVTVLLEVMRRRAGTVSPTAVLRRYGEDRFSAPAAVPFAELRRIEDAFLSVLPTGVDMLALSPLLPLGAHSVALVGQDRIVSTARLSEVAADPTNGLALEAAARRRALLKASPRSSDVVSLAAIQRVVRAQLFKDDRSFAHFQIFGLVTAGRDRGKLAFEQVAAAEHVSFAIRALHAAGASEVRVELTDLGGHRRVCDAVREGLAGGADAVDRPDRVEARHYYSGFCFKAFALFHGEPFETTDGGLVDWTQRLVPSQKERMMISGTGLDRVALGKL
jgi:hypothetical protein